ncbi:MAG: 30S ribosomal protein S20 [Deltaproteobacteria bacterium]
MPQRKAAIKRLRIDKKRTQSNAGLKADLKKVLKGFKALVAKQQLEEAKAQLKIAYASLDRAVTKGILHRNTAARRKSSLALMLSKRAPSAAQKGASG